MDHILRPTKFVMVPNVTIAPLRQHGSSQRKVCAILGLLCCCGELRELSSTVLAAAGKCRSFPLCLDVRLCKGCRNVASHVPSTFCEHLLDVRWCRKRGDEGGSVVWCRPAFHGRSKRNINRCRTAYLDDHMVDSHQNLSKPSYSNFTIVLNFQNSYSLCCRRSTK